MHFEKLVEGVAQSTTRVNCIKHLLFKQADRGLYYGETIRFGFYRTSMRNRIKRTWKPNVHRICLYSEALGSKLPLKVSKKALDEIDNSGGLDHYILEQKQLESKCAHKIRTKILLAKYERELKEANLINK